ncbi:hypothetical protein OFEAOIEE_LOCUS2376 [Methylorubrum extorquens]
MSVVADKPDPWPGGDPAARPVVRSQSSTSACLWDEGRTVRPGLREEGSRVAADVEPYRPAPIRRLIRRASPSEATSASIETATEIRVRRKAPASPPGTWVRV